MIMLLLWIFIVIMLLVVLSLILIPLLILRFLLTALGLLIFLPLFALSFYWLWGAAPQIEAWAAQQQQIVHAQELMAQFKSPKEVIEALKTRLKADPQSAKGWYLLGKLYLDQQNYAEASQAFARANELHPNKPEVMVALAQTLFFENNRLLDPKSTALLNEVLTLDPKNKDALNLLAIGAYNAGDYPTATRYWQELLPLLTEGSEEQNLVIEMLSQVKKKSP